jgi:hypothetical protein
MNMNMISPPLARRAGLGRRIARAAGVVRGSHLMVSPILSHHATLRTIIREGVLLPAGAEAQSRPDQREGQQAEHARPGQQGEEWGVLGVPAPLALGVARLVAALGALEHGVREEAAAGEEG